MFFADREVQVPTTTRSFFAALLCLLSFGPAAAQTASNTPQSPPKEAQGDKASAASYWQLVERAKGGDATVDFVQMRDAFAAWLCQEKKTDAPNRDAMVAAFKAQDYAKAAELAEAVLDYEFVNRGLHLAAEDAYRKSGNAAKADFHKDVAEKLLRALLGSGDGKSAETAYRVLSISEEYFIMRQQLGYKVSSQSLVMVKERPYDVLSGTDPKTGKNVSLYFDIGSFFGGCDKK